MGGRGRHWLKMVWQTYSRVVITTDAGTTVMGVYGGETGLSSEYGRGSGDLRPRSRMGCERGGGGAVNRWKITKRKYQEKGDSS